MTELLIKNSDLVLNVSNNYDLDLFDLDKYEGFLGRLCGNREYQKEAIRKACIYLLGGRYDNLADLASENYQANEILNNKYGSLNHFLESLHFSNKLACNIDLATGTGKSYVIYGIAQIMLCEGKIDRVLVLCPSVTIEEGLTKKFRLLSSDADLKRLLPAGAVIKNPRISQANGTIEKGDICIENIHSTYKNTKSAIEDSLLHHGEKTLILNDEAHHIYSKVDSNVKKRYEFLLDKDYDFKYIVGFSGTPYTDNEYFPDIVYRYSLIEGMEDRFIKKIDYVIADTMTNNDAYIKMQIIYENHQRIIKQYFQIKPITIVISKDIAHCEKDRKSIIDFLVNEKGVSKEDAEKQVLIVTSHKDHKKNLDILREVHKKDNPVEWICSVAMLTEGWDVPNVFQIVPSEEKAFNSKLLISQVLGRGLRVPEEYTGEELHVKVLNHARFSPSITNLVDEVLEREDRIFSYPISQKEKYNFDIHNLEYDRNPIEEEREVSNEVVYNFEKLKKEGINIPAQAEEEAVRIQFEVMGTNNIYNEEIVVKRKLVETDDLANNIYNKLQSRDIELGTHYADEYTFEVIKEIIQKSLDKRELKIITKDIASKFMQAFGTLRRGSNKVVRYKKDPIKIITKNSKEIAKSGLALSNVINHKGAVFYDENSIKYSEELDKIAIEKLKDEAGRKYMVEVENSFLFRTPVNLVFASSDPEKDFIDALIKKEPFDPFNTIRHIYLIFSLTTSHILTIARVSCSQ